MITQQKFIYVALYYTPDTTACGCYLLGIDRLAADLSMTASSLDDALDEFVRRGLILRDKVTGEIFVVDWPRWHNFENPRARGALWSSIAKIQSRDLWIKVESAYKSIPEPGKGKEKGKGKASSNEEDNNAGGSGVPAGWWTSNDVTEEVGKMLNMPARPQEDWSSWKARLRVELDSRKRGDRTLDRPDL